MKKIFLNIILTIVPIMITMTLLLAMRSNVVKVKESNANVVKNDLDFVYKVENETNTNQYLYLSGYLFDKQETVLKSNMSLVLIDTKHNKQYTLPTEIVKREDIVDEYEINNGNNVYCGYESLAKVDQIESGIYRLYCYYKSNDRNVMIDMGTDIKIGE